MEVFSTPRVILSGVATGVGKSLLSLGLAMELRKRSQGLSTCVLGLSLIEAIVHRRVTGRYVRCLDERLLSRGQVLTSLYSAGVGADVLLIEGSRGLYDSTGRGSVLSGSDAEIAAVTKTPVVLVFDARGFGSSVAALLRGYRDMASGFDVLGAIANRMSVNEGECLEQRELFNEALLAGGLTPLVGAVPEFKVENTWSSSALTQERNNAVVSRNFLVDLGTLVSRNIDIERLLSIAQSALDLRLEDYVHRPVERRCRVAVSDDSAFNLCFQDNLDYLRYYGADVVAFSPLADAALPQKIGALYLTGGYLREYGAELANNHGMMRSIRDFYQAGGVIYSEGAGTAFLCRQFQLADGTTLDGVGIIPGVAVCGEEQLSYGDAVTVEESVLGRQGLIVKGVALNDWRLTKDDNPLRVLRVSRQGSQSVMEGFSPGAQTASTFHFFHWGSNPEIAKNIVEAGSVVCKL